jgi:hypothetical protein|tara:strand:- start:37 stop:360 length:324 start_codon:yes stop_codon:yes gene_type:complete
MAFKMNPKSPLLKSIGHQTPQAIKPAVSSSPSSPAKQVKVKDLPKVVAEKVDDVKDKVVSKVKDIGEKLGNITLSSKERVACKKAGGKYRKKKCYMPKKVETKKTNK